MSKTLIVKSWTGTEFRLTPKLLYRDGKRLGTVADRDAALQVLQGKGRALIALTGKPPQYVGTLTQSA